MIRNFVGTNKRLFTQILEKCFWAFDDYLAENLYQRLDNCKSDKELIKLQIELQNRLYEEYLKSEKAFRTSFPLLFINKEIIEDTKEGRKIIALSNYEIEIYLCHDTENDLYDEIEKKVNKIYC